MTHANSLGPPRSGRKVDTPEECMRKLREEEARAKENGILEIKTGEAVLPSMKPVLQSRLPNGIETIIKESLGSWRLSPIRLRGGLYTYDLWKSFLGQGMEANLRDWTNLSKENESQGYQVACAGDVLFSIADFLYPHINSNTEAENAWTFLGKALSLQAGNQQVPVLLSKCVYGNIGEKDKVIHDIGLNTQYTEIGRLWGPDGWDGWLLNTWDELVMLTLGCTDPGHARDILTALTGRPPYVTRLACPSSTTERPLSIGIPKSTTSNPTICTYLDASGSCRTPAIGVDYGPAIGVKQIRRIWVPGP